MTQVGILRSVALINVASFSELWFSTTPLPKKSAEQWRRRTDFSNHAAPNAFQMEQLAWAKRAGTSLEKLKTLGLAGFVESTETPAEPAVAKGQDNLDNDNDDLKTYVQQITAAALSGAGISALGGSDDADADEIDEDEEDS